MFCREVLVARERLPGARRLADNSLLAGKYLDTERVTKCWRETDGNNDGQ